jgi:hypothetical protein
MVRIQINFQLIKKVLHSINIKLFIPRCIQKETDVSNLYQCPKRNARIHHICVHIGNSEKDARALFTLHAQDRFGNEARLLCIVTY